MTPLFGIKMTYPFFTVILAERIKPALLFNDFRGMHRLHTLQLKISERGTKLLKKEGLSLENRDTLSAELYTLHTLRIQSNSAWVSKGDCSFYSVILLP